MDTLLLTDTDVARELHICRAKVWQLLQSGALPSVKLGRSRRVLASALRAYVERLAAEQAAK